MKLNLIFIVMDFLTILAYPILYLYSKRCQLLKAKANIDLPNLQTMKI